MDELLRRLVLTANEIVLHYQELRGWMVTYNDADGHMSVYGD